jgi:homoserine dehydrogenase
MNPIKTGVAVLGLGTIGGEVARAILANDRLNLVAALERGPERADRVGIARSFIRTEATDVIDDPDVQVVVEVLGGEQPAADLMIRALASGKHVVTANKEAVSKNLPAILAAASDGDAAFLCEASVGGGIPLFVSLKAIMESNQIERVRGIVNGTTNYILWKMETEGTAYADALAQAQELGYAEPDPTADVEGFDASYKLAILGSLITGRHVRPEEIDRTGISAVTSADINAAKERGGTIRLIASAERDGENIAMRVAPTFVALDDLFSHVSANYNALEIVGDRVGPVLLHGQGAGPAPTSSAILSDIFEAIRSGSSATPNVVLRVD